MSYSQAMQWHKKHPTGGKPQYMGFDSSSGGQSRRDIIRELFKSRNDGERKPFRKWYKSNQFMRECIRMHIKLIRQGNEYTK